jgi:magnesium transporter
MINRHARGPVHWIDLESPTRTELQDVLREFSVDPRVEEEIITETPYPIVVSSKEYLYLVLHFPTTGPSGQAKNQEIDFIIGKDFLLTIRDEAIDSIHNLHKVFEAEELLEFPTKSEYADDLLERVLYRLYAVLREDVETIGKRLTHIETDIFGGKERSTVRAISEINRVLLRFDMTIKRHEESLSSLLEELSRPHFFGKEFIERSTRIEAEREHVASLIHSYREVANELRDTNDSLLSASQNEVMKTLTVITVIILPLSLIVDLFQMTVPGVPLSHNSYGFWIISGMVILLTIFLVLYSKLKRWL